MAALRLRHPAHTDREAGTLHPPNSRMKLAVTASTMALKARARTLKIIARQTLIIAMSFAIPTCLTQFATTIKLDSVPATRQALSTCGALALANLL